MLHPMQKEIQRKKELYRKVIDDSGETLGFAVGLANVSSFEYRGLVEGVTHRFTPEKERVNPYLAKRCPFCGALPNIIYEEKSRFNAVANVVCTGFCVLTETITVAGTVEEAFELWNTRYSGEEEEWLQ
jgi:hypothetical protein